MTKKSGKEKISLLKKDLREKERHKITDIPNKYVLIVDLNAKKRKKEEFSHKSLRNIATVQAS